MEPYAPRPRLRWRLLLAEPRGPRALRNARPSARARGLLFVPAHQARQTPCLGVCVSGPIVVVYPEGVWYAGVTPALLERIVVEHLRDGRVVEGAVFHRLTNGK